MPPIYWQGGGIKMYSFHKIMEIYKEMLNFHNSVCGEKLYLVLSFQAVHQNMLSDYNTSSFIWKSLVLFNFPFWK